jgi:hypothetical protein
VSKDNDMTDSPSPSTGGSTKNKSSKAVEVEQQCSMDATYATYEVNDDPALADLTPEPGGHVVQTIGEPVEAP